MLEHEWYHFAILRKAVNSNHYDHLGWPTTWGSLGQAIRETGLNETARGPMDALMWMQGRKLIILKKTYSHGLGFTTYDYDEHPDKRSFFWGEFGIYVTPEGSAYFNELEAKARASMHVLPPKQNEIGFHA